MATHLSAISSPMLAATVASIKIRIFPPSQMKLQAMLAVDSFRFSEQLPRLRAATEAWVNVAMKALFTSKTVKPMARLITTSLQHRTQVGANRLPNRPFIDCPLRSQTQAIIVLLRHLGASSSDLAKCLRITKAAQNRAIKAPNWRNHSQRFYQEASSCITKRLKTVLSLMRQTRLWSGTLIGKSHIFIDIGSWGTLRTVTNGRIQS